MNYPETLAAAWAAHLAPKPPDAPTVVSLFAGAGGSSLGYSMAGFRELLAVEWDKHAAGCFAANFPDVPLHVGDIANVDPGSLNLPPGELDVLDGSPPCQGFSVAGKRQLDDPRNQLFREYVRLLRAWKPRAFVMENVSGMGLGKMRNVLREVLTELRSSGYQISAAELIASYYGVPQRRKRLIIIGVREDLQQLATHPAPTTTEITFNQAITDLPDPGSIKEISKKHKILAPHIKPGELGSHVLKKGGLKESNFGLCRASANKPIRTILKNSGYTILHPSKLRALGTAELARLQSFPDEYEWGDSTYNQIQARLGNSVPPLFMAAIARHLKETLYPLNK